MDITRIRKTSPGSSGIQLDKMKLLFTCSLCLPLFITMYCLLQPVNAGNACCSYPCQNGGVCLTKGNDYSCDCSQTEFNGKNCDKPTFMKRIKMMLKPDPDTTHFLMTHFKWIWDFINGVEYLSDTVMKKVYTLRSNMIDSPPTYESEHSYITLEANFNYSYYTRTLPPVPKECPTPMGTVGKKELPDLDVIVDTFFRRVKFRPEPMGTSVMFSFFAQHFTHQFFKTDLKKGPGFQWGGHGVDMTHVYGRDKAARDSLRSFKDGKMKVQMIEGEEYPPLTKEAPVYMTYHPKTPDNLRFAIGHEFFGLLPGLFMYATIWIREHNRVCDIMKKEHPEWDDERLYQTTRLILLGETIKIVVEDYVQHLSGYNFKLKFKPDLLFGEPFQYQNRISVEFNHLYHWHPLMPSEFTVQNDTYSVEQSMFHADIVIKHGMHDFVDAVSKQRAGAFGPVNHGPVTIPVVKQLVQHGRTLRLQSFNQYRKRFNMRTVKSFEELTGEKVFAQKLRELYGDIDAVEFYVGLILEKRRPGAVFGSSIVEMGGPYSVKGLMANPICSPRYWKPSTFGGDVGFDIVNSASIEQLFCKNIKGKCPYVSFKVPDLKQVDVDEPYVHTEL